MSASLAEPELGEYAKKCIEVIRTFVPGREDEVEPAIRLLASIYANENKDTVEKRFEEEYKVYKAAAVAIESTNLLDEKYEELSKEGNR